ncbi:hypothetical protein [Smaragdicoccus niigatensis]|uniref:hypothetical protein n=1 Tax=Smaragdicoccus niigatensis TaxID=359359 RepID=UPI00035C10B8|nr:hypothetical protein [Smaragdicoccus niigatensis]
MASTTIERTSAPSWPLLAVIGVALSLIFTAIGTFWDVMGNDDPANSQGVFEYLVGAAITVIAAAIAVAVAVRFSTATVALVLAGIGFLSLAVFWAGLPSVLASAAVAAAVRARTRNAATTTAIGVALVTVVLAGVLAVVG